MRKLMPFSDIIGSGPWVLYLDLTIENARGMLISPGALRSVLRTLDLRGGVLLAESLLKLGRQGVWAEESLSIHLTADFFILK